MSEKIRFESGDIFLFYTDGITEAMKGDIEFGEERVRDFLIENKNNSGNQILNKLFTTVKRFSDLESDDLTAILLKIK